MPHQILIVDDEADVRQVMTRWLTARGHHVAEAADGKQAIQAIQSVLPDLVIMDIRMPGMSGLQVLAQIKQIDAKLPVVIMTAHGTTESAIEATKLGAFDYLLKPFEPEQMATVAARALQCGQLTRRQVELAPQKPALASDAIIGQGPAMQEVYKAIGSVAQTNATVLVRGETGTGKELVARAIYQHSRRREKPLYVVDCAAMVENLLESELFGHEKGAFTHALACRIGKFEQAHGATLFLDEIGESPPAVQVKLLRVLQEGTIQRVGGNETIHVDVRILAATNRNLEQAIKEGKFREDLYYRLNVVTIELPPLRERNADIARLADFLLARLSCELGIDKPPLADSALQVIREHPWPGNVRELEHCLQQAAILSRGYPIQAEDIRRALDRSVETVVTAEGASDEARMLQLVRQYLQTHSGPMTHGKFLELADRLLVLEALRLAGGNQTRAATTLGLTRQTLQAKMNKHEIRRNADR